MSKQASVFSTVWFQANGLIISMYVCTFSFLDEDQGELIGLGYVETMNYQTFRLCLAAQAIAPTHGTFFAAALLAEQDVALEHALYFLASARRKISYIELIEVLRGMESENANLQAER